MNLCIFLLYLSYLWMFIYIFILLDLSMKSPSSIIMPLSPVNHYERLPDNQQIKMLFRQFQNNLLNQKSNKCFLNVSCLNNALLFASLCFSGLAVLEYLKGLNKKDIQLLQQYLNQFTWDQELQSFILFQKNAKTLGSIYSFYFEKIFTPFNQLNSHQISQIFANTLNSSNFLYGVKIRFLQNSLNKFKRNYQSQEIQRINGTKYLIFHQIKGGSCNFGMVFYQNQTNSTLSDLNSKQYPYSIQKKMKKKNDKPQLKAKIIKCETEITQQQQETFTKKQDMKQKKKRYKSDKKTLRCPCQLI